MKGDNLSSIFGNISREIISILLTHSSSLLCENKILQSQEIMHVYNGLIVMNTAKQQLNKYKTSSINYIALLVLFN